MAPCLCPPRGLKILTHKSTALPRLCSPNELLTFTRKSTQDVLASAPLTFTRKSTQDVLASAPLTFTHKSTGPQRLCLPIMTFDFHSQVNTNVLSSAHPRLCYPSAWSSSSLSQLTADFDRFGTGSPLWHISFCGAVLSLV